MTRFFALLQRVRGMLNLLFGKAVNEDPRRRATWVSWSDEDPSLDVKSSNGDQTQVPHP